MSMRLELKRLVLSFRVFWFCTKQPKPKSKWTLFHSSWVKASFYFFASFKLKAKEATRTRKARNLTKVAKWNPKKKESWCVRALPEMREPPFLQQIANKPKPKARTTFTSSTSIQTTIHSISGASNFPFFSFCSVLVFLLSYSQLASLRFPFSTTQHSFGMTIV